MFPRLSIFACLLTVFLCADVAAQGRQTTQLDQILKRYRDSLGGLANLSRIQTVRIEGEIMVGENTVQRITVLKKKPNMVRTTILSPNSRFVQGYDGKEAWVMFERLGRTYLRPMEGAEKDDFVRSAPIENVFINPSHADATLSLGPDVMVGHMDCHQMIADFADGSRQVIAIDKEEFRDRQIAFFDADGVLTSEIIPSDFQVFNGIVFAMRVLRRSEGGGTSTMVINSVEINIGLFDSLFNYPLLRDPAAP